MLQASSPGRCRYLALCVVLLALLILSACGSGNAASTGGSKTTPTAPTVTLSASASNVVAGGSLTLTVVASSATEFVISDNCDNQTTTMQATGAAQPVQVTVPTTPGTCTYTATASGTGGQASVTSGPITVQPSTATTVSMTTSTPTIGAGAPVTFNVAVTNANSVFITNNIDNSSVPVAAGGGAATISPGPHQTTTYTVTATGTHNQATAQVTITVMSVSITAAPNTIVAGSPTTLTVTAANATQVVISNNIDSTTDTLAGTGGTYSPKPAATTIYTATATSGSATATATATVTVHATADASLINHVIFLMQENRTFDTYFGMLNKYRANQSTSGQAWNIGDDGIEYDVDGIAGTSGVVANFSNKTDIVTCPAAGQYGTPPITCTPGSPVPGLDGSSIPLFKFATSCVDDMTSDWLGSYGDVSRYNFTTQRKINMDGFVHIAYNYAQSGNGSGNMTDDPNGQRAMGYYDQSFLNYYYYMASQFALSDRWFSPVSSKSTPNRIATLTGGTTQGLVYDPFKNDNIGTQLTIPTIFSKLDKAGVSWRIYYGVTNGGCTDPDGDCGTSTLSAYPSITFADFTDSYKYLYVPATKGNCIAPTIPSGTPVPVGPGDPQNAFCIDPTHLAPVSQYFTDVANGTLPSFAFVEPAYGHNDEHPGSGQSILTGQAQVASMVNALMSSSSWADSVFFLSYDEGGGPFDHVPPVPTHSNDFSGPATGIAANVLSTIPDIASIAVNADTYYPCPANGPVDPVTLKPTPTLHCDLVDRGNFQDPGYNAGDAASAPALGGEGFAAQLGFRLPNLVISPFTRKHYVSHVPMDHTAILKFVEDRFIKDGNYLTLRDAAQPNLLDFFDFVNAPWATPPAAGGIPTPTPVGATCTPATMH